MKTSSPLRYPGGKSSMAGLLGKIRKLNRLGDRSVAEPFAGGAGASLSLLYHEETPDIYINDADHALFDFWWTIVNRPDPFLELLETIDVDMNEWRRQRDIYRSRGRQSRLRRGFATFYLNRTNRSGIIINGGPLGGIDQSGKWKLDARFNKTDLCHRCKKVANYRDRIHVSCQDGIEFIRCAEQRDHFFFIDPPYFSKGKTLYLNELDTDNHIALAEQLKSMKDAAWILTYDDCPEIREMYKGWTTIRSFALRYTAYERRSGREVLVAPLWIDLPQSQGSAALEW